MYKAERPGGYNNPNNSVFATKARGENGVAANRADVVKHVLDAFDRLLAKAPLDLRLAPWTPPPPSYHTERDAKKATKRRGTARSP